MNKKYIYLLLPIILVFSSCSFAEKNTVTLTASNRFFPIGTESIMVTWNNNTDNAILFGEEFGIEKKNNDEWERVHYSSNYTFNDISIKLPSKSQKVQKYDLLSYIGKDLPAGEYRIRCNFSFDDDKHYTEKDYYVVYAEFTIK